MMETTSRWDGRRAWGLAESGHNSELSDLIDRNFGAICRIRVQVDDGALQPLAQWKIVGENESRIVVGRKVDGQKRINVNSRTFDTLPLIAAYHQYGAPSIGTVPLSLEDWGITPGLAYCDNRTGSFLIPDAMFIASVGYDDTRHWYTSNDIPWADRRPVAFWRGHDFGPTVRDWRDLPRVRLCAIAGAEANGHLFDVGISPHLGKLTFHEIQTSGFMRESVSVRDFNHYRYHIDIDGRTNSWPGLFQKLLTGSPVLKVASTQGFCQWYYPRLRPWVNFIPVASDMSDLAEKVAWLRDHDDTARQVGKNGQALAWSLTFEAELKAAGKTIAAAVKYVAEQPEFELQLGTDARHHVRLVAGWAVPGKDGLPMSGTESRLELPRPIASESFVIILDLSPDVGAPAQRASLQSTERFCAKR